MVEAKHQVSTQYDDLKDAQRRMRALMRLTLRGMHGYPVPELGIAEKSSIKNPLPEQVLQGLSQVREMNQRSGQLSDQVVDGINRVIEMQKQYAASKQAPQPQSQPQEQQVMEQQVPQEQPPEPEQEQPQLTAEASNRLTRTMATVRALGGYFDKSAWNRLTALKDLAKIKRLTKQLMNYVLSRGNEDSIFDAVMKMDDIYSELNAANKQVKLIIETREKEYGNKTPPPEPAPDAPKPEDEVAEEHKMDVEVRDADAAKASARATATQTRALKEAKQLLERMDQMKPGQRKRFIELANLAAVDPKNDLVRKIFEEMKSNERRIAQDQALAERFGIEVGEAGPAVVPTPAAEQQVAEPQEPEAGTQVQGWTPEQMDAEVQKYVEFANSVNNIISDPSYKPPGEAMMQAQDLFNQLRAQGQKIHESRIKYGTARMENNQPVADEAFRAIQEAYNQMLPVVDQLQLNVAKISTAVSGQLGRWWGRKKLQLVHGGPYATFRRNADRHITVAYDTLESLLDELETRNWTVPSVSKKMRIIWENLRDAMRQIGSAGNKWNNRLKTKRREGDIKKGEMEASQLRDKVNSFLNKFPRLMEDEISVYKRYEKKGEPALPPPSQQEIDNDDCIDWR